ncbi:MAG: TIGR02587 family membrane protein, partial [Acidobacteria bacterium]|nr:TIGR02587 family membrane protein [Acidobacteriota bacterium]
MSDPKSNRANKRITGSEFFSNLARAYGGAILFSFPMLMTMEMWWLGFYMNGIRLTLFTLLSIPM